VKAGWSEGSQIEITWVPAANDQGGYLDIYHRVGVVLLSDTGASPWVVVASHLNINSASFVDTRPHVPHERHIYKICAVGGPQVACSTPVGAPR
jgi:hypothetical protein